MPATQTSTSEWGEVIMKRHSKDILVIKKYGGVLYLNCKTNAWEIRVNGATDKDAISGKGIQELRQMFFPEEWVEIREQIEEHRLLALA